MTKSLSDFEWPPDPALLNRESFALRLASKEVAAALGNLSVVTGDHVVTFRHPKFGEKTTSVSVKVGVHARLSMDMRK